MFGLRLRTWVCLLTALCAWLLQRAVVGHSTGEFNRHAASLLAEAQLPAGDGTYVPFHLQIADRERSRNDSARRQVDRLLTAGRPRQAAAVRSARCREVRRELAFYEAQSLPDYAGAVILGELTRQRQWACSSLAREFRQPTGSSRKQ